MMEEIDPFANSKDPLIDEVRTIRKEISERFDNDVNKHIDYLQERQQEYADRIVTRHEPKPLESGNRG
ncbi:MAG TPA: hypothetical protein VNT79_07280 [Phycisphaerae bacterium]|nr:hypothetical protein [Phycisphaerae bacterium]